MSRDTVKIEPIPEDESFLDKITREGDLETFTNLMITTISTILFIAILICFLCYLSKKKTPKKQCSFDAFVYIDLQMKTEVRVTNVTNETLSVQEKKPKGSIMQSVEEEDGSHVQDFHNQVSPVKEQEKR